MDYCQSRSRPSFIFVVPRFFVPWEFWCKFVGGVLGGGRVDYLCNELYFLEVWVFAGLPIQRVLSGSL